MRRGDSKLSRVLRNSILCAVLLAVFVGFTSPDLAEAQLLRGGDSAQSAEQAGSLAWLPEPVKDAIAWTAKQQIALNRTIQAEVKAYRQSGQLSSALALIGICFLYGIFHAVGPGHGKAVVSSYFLAREAAIKRGLMLGGAIAMIQAVSAVTIVAVMGWFLDGRRLEILANMALLEAVSYGLVVVLGAGMLWASLTGRDCGHDHSGMGEHDHHHDHHHHEHGHGHDCGHHHHHGPVADRPGQTSVWEFAGAAIVSGLRPCTGALIVLFFTLANGILLIGIVATFAMAFGVAITVSSVGITAILVRRGLVKAGSATAGEGWLSRYSMPALRALSIVGSCFVFISGVMLLLGTVQRQGLMG